MSLGYGFDGFGYGGAPAPMASPAPATAPAPAPAAVGGTSGTGSNSLSMNLGGVNVNYDLGPSVSTIAGQSESYLASSFNADTALLGGAMIGANSLVAGLTAPLIAGSLNQMTVNNAQLPSIYNTLMEQNYSLGQGAIAAEEQAAQASMKSSAASAQAASSAGGCYITTAVCDSCGLPDDCYTLRTLRNFRDKYLLPSNVGRSFVEEYYATAPALCLKIAARIDARDYLRALYTRFILPALLAIEWKRPADAFKIYRRMIYAVRAENP